MLIKRFLPRSVLLDGLLIGDGDELAEVVNPLSSFTRLVFFLRNRKMIRRYYFKNADGVLVNVWVITKRKLIPHNAKVVEVRG